MFAPRRDSLMRRRSIVRGLLVVAVATGCDFSSAPSITVKRVLAAGSGYTCGLTSSGVAYCWGNNDYGQLGTGSTTKSPRPAAVAGGLSFSALATEFSHSCGLTSAGEVYCWGANDFGQ